MPSTTTLAEQIKLAAGALEIENNRLTACLEEAAMRVERLRRHAAKIVEAETLEDRKRLTDELVRSCCYIHTVGVTYERVCELLGESNNAET